MMLVIATILISILLFILLWRVIKVSIGLLLVIVAVIVGLQYGFGIEPEQLWAEIQILPQKATHFVQGFNWQALTSIWLD